MEDVKRKASGENLSEDDVIRIEKEIQKLTDEFTGKVDTLASEKEKELMTL